MATNHENQSGNHHQDNSTFLMILGLIFGAGLGVVCDALFETHGMGIGIGTAVGIAFGSLFITVPDTNSDPKCYKRGFVVFIPLGGLLFVVGILSIRSNWDVLRILAWAFWATGFVFVMTGLSFGRKYRDLSS